MIPNPAPKEKLSNYADPKMVKMVPPSLIGPELEIIWPLSEFYHNRSPNSVRLWCASHKYESNFSSTAVTELTDRSFRRLKSSLKFSISATRQIRHTQADLECTLQCRDEVPSPGLDTISVREFEMI